VRKVNIDTDLRLASTGAIRQFMAKHPDEFDPRKYLKETITEMKVICKERYEAFGAAGQADKIKVIALENMAVRYEKGELNPRVQ
jgi:fructose-bisphosphate aldolase class II